MTLDKITGLAFNTFYILILIFFILRSITLIRRDNNYREKLKENRDVARTMGLLVLDAGSNRAFMKGDFIHLKNGMTLGRSEDNSIIMTDPFISSHHTRFFLHNGRFVIEDMNSKNGTILNKDRLLKKTYLRNDDIITVGTSIFRVISR